MQVNMTSLTSALTTALRQSTSSNSVFLTQDETQGSQGAGTSQTIAANSDNAVTGTGTGSSLLSARTALDLIGQTQQVAGTATAPGSGTVTSGSSSSSATTTDTASAVSTNGNGETNSSDVWPYRMQEVASNPTYASQVAERMSSNYLVTGYCPLFAAGDPGTSETSAYAMKQADDLLGKSQAIVDTVQQQVQALYQSDKAQRKSGAQTVTDILKLQLSQPQSYWAAMDPFHLQGDLNAQTQDQLNELQQAMSKSAQSSSASSVTGQTA